MDEPASEHRAVLARNAALARLRRLTRGMIAATVGLTGIFAALAAGSTHPRKTIAHAATRSSRTATVTKTPTVSPPPATTSADNESDSTPVAPVQTTPAAPAPAPAAPAQAPTPATSPPVVVTGTS